MDGNALVKAAGIGTVLVIALKILSWIPCIGWVFAIMTLFAYILVGAVYGHFAKQSGIRAEMVQTALFGGAAAGLASVIPAIFSGIGGDSFFLIQGIAIGFAVCISFALTFFLGVIGGGVYGLLID